ncbi:hypothetical protein [Miniphocaeibacter halophilus]|uniref:Uncharacterized protein n=1 Tax=Miniphocaeibacter halophilus TaxID=2931922 RepID=A0AC61MSZ0_9FIRM|nr:hypothetical protein [Miniphocaeibacter halophilus]QQK08795.1 hypothetical protein JFY71_04485 [Miniphocaeibacter halophilus]
MKLRKRRKLNKGLEKELPLEYREKIDDIINYINFNNISIYEAEAIKTDLLEMAINGAERNENLDFVFGINKEEFAKEIYSNAKQMTFLEKIINKAYSIGDYGFPIVTFIFADFFLAFDRYFKGIDRSVKISTITLIFYGTLMIYSIVFQGKIKKYSLNINKNNFYNNGVFKAILILGGIILILITDSLMHGIKINPLVGWIFFIIFYGLSLFIFLYVNLKES